MDLCTYDDKSRGSFASANSGWEYKQHGTQASYPRFLPRSTQESKPSFMAATRSSRSNPRLSTSSIPSVKPSSSLTESPADTPTLLNRRTDDVFQSIIKGRKSWKTARGGEIVWPPELESALIEGACLDARSPPSSSCSIKLNQQNRFGKLPAR